MSIHFYLVNFARLPLAHESRSFFTFFVQLDLKYPILQYVTFSYLYIVSFSYVYTKVVLHYLLNLWLCFQYTPEFLTAPEILTQLPYGQFLKVNAALLVTLIYVGKILELFKLA